MKEVKCDAFVLRVTPFRDRARILTLFTQEGGLLNALIKGVDLKKNALVTPLAEIECVLKRGRSDLYSFVDGALIDPNYALRQKSILLKTAGQIAADLLASQMPEKPAPALYALMRSLLHLLPTAEKPQNLGAAFRLKLLRHEGVINPRGDESALNKLLIARSLEEIDRIDMHERDFEELDILYKDAKGEI